MNRKFCEKCTRHSFANDVDIIELCPKHALVDELITMLKRSRDAIESLEADSLGIGSADGGYTHWWIRDELLSNIGLILAKAERIKG